MRHLLVVVTVAASALFLALNSSGNSHPAQARVSMDSLPDLVVTSMSVQFEPGVTCNWSGHSLGTLVWVKNNGDAGAGPFVVEFVLDTNSWEQAVPSGLAAGQTTSVWFPAYSYNWHEVTATADATFEVTESDETNNTLTQILAIPTPPATCTPGPSPTPTPSPTEIPSVGDPVGGIAELPGAPAGAAEAGAPDNDSSRTPYLTVAGAAAGAVLVAGGWYLRRRRRAG